jgi:hypothetical protein
MKEPNRFDEVIQCAKRFPGKAIVESPAEALDVDFDTGTFGCYPVKYRRIMTELRPSPESIVAIEDGTAASTKCVSF